MTALRPPGDRPAAKPLVAAALLTAVPVGLVVTAVVTLAPASVRGPLIAAGAGGVILLCMAVAVAAHFRQTSRSLQRRFNSLTEDAGRLLHERARLTEELERERERAADRSAAEESRLQAELERERARFAKESERERAQLTESFATEHARMTKDFTAERAQLTEDFDTQLTRLNEDFTAERKRLTEEFAVERARLTEDISAERTRLTEGFTAERMRLDEEFATEREQLTKSFAAERESFTAEREAFTAERARLTGKNKRLTAELRTANAERASALAATANAAGRMQALATGTLAELRAMEERHHDEEVLTDLLQLDHRTAQAGRLADSIAVLSGARSGRRWARPIAMESILRGAMGRIGAYQRVRLHSVSDVAVAGHAAEGVMHALAELLDNAATFSPPTAEVHVYVEEVPAGVIVSVEDSGLVMGDVQLRRAEKAVTGENTGGLGGLTGTRLGLTVVGRLARKYGLKVSFRPSARGGTGVLVLVPQDILVGPRTEHGSAVLPRTSTPRTSTPPTSSRTSTRTEKPRLTVAPTPAPEPVPEHGAADRGDASVTGSSRGDAPKQDESPDGTDGTSLPELPKRRRGRTYAEAERTRARPEKPKPAACVDTRDRVARLSTFRKAVRAAREVGVECPDGAAGILTETAETAETASSSDATETTATTTPKAPPSPTTPTTPTTVPDTDGTESQSLGAARTAREKAGRTKGAGKATPADTTAPADMADTTHPADVDSPTDAPHPADAGTPPRKDPDTPTRTDAGTPAENADAPAGESGAPGQTPGDNDAVTHQSAAAVAVARSHVETPEGGTRS